MHPGRPGPTPWAGSADRRALRVNAHYLDIHVYRQHRDVRDCREQQLLQPEHDLFHSPDFQPNHPGNG